MTVYAAEEQAELIIDRLCECIERFGWSYRKSNSPRAVSFTVTGEDIPIDIVFYIDERNRTIKAFSPLASRIPQDKLLDGAVAVCAANCGLCYGCFDYDEDEGTVSFRVAASYRDGDIGEELLRYLVRLICSVVDYYNDRFLALCEGQIGISDILGVF